MALAVAATACGDSSQASVAPTPFEAAAVTPTPSEPEPETVAETKDAAATVAPFDAGASASFPDAAPDDGESGGAFASCAAIELSATVRSVPMDIVWVIDSSPSMRNERAAIQASLNRFAAQFASADIDVRVVVMTDGDDFEVPAPLGTDPARFLLVDRNVGSRNALRFFARRFDEYSAFLRPEAQLELIAVTDDDSGISAEEFLTEMQAAAAKDFRLHAIASERVDGRACRGAASPGDEYYAAAARTQGLTFSVCEADGSELFQALADGLTAGAPLPCSLTVPDPPNGQQLEPGLVNLVPQGPPGTPKAEPIPSVSDLATCSDLGWYYEDAATISLCPNTCERFDTGSLSVEFGCATRVF